MDADFSTASDERTYEPERRSCNAPPNIWGDYLQELLANSDAFNEENISQRSQEHERLKEEVRKILIIEIDHHAGKPNSWEKKLELIDTVQRLGVSYHFETEIQAILVHASMLMEQEEDGLDDDDDLHVVALRFRLLRELGHHVSSDVFDKFKDDEGNFKESLVDDVRSLLSLYEAANYRVHNEHNLEEALKFTTSQLVFKLPNLDDLWAPRVKLALEVPIQKSLNRVTATQFLPLYEQDVSHDAVLLKFAKLDFNILQKQYQEELRILAKWWEGLDCETHLPFVRVRLVENFLWSVSVYFELKYSLARLSYTKMCCMVLILDDIFDTYGFLHELVLFTDSIERWHIRESDRLPSYMIYFYRLLLNFYCEIEERLAKEGKSDIVKYAIASTKDLVRSFFQEAKWMHNKDAPSFEEYIKVGVVSGTYQDMLPMNALVGAGEFISEAALDWMTKTPLIIRANGLIVRLMDDIADYERDKEAGIVASAVECYMKQYGTSKEETLVELQKQLLDAWKDINQECLNPTSVIPKFILEIIVNHAKIVYLFFHAGNDEYTNPVKAKDIIKSVLFDPVTL